MSVGKCECVCVKVSVGVCIRDECELVFYLKIA